MEIRIDPSRLAAVLAASQRERAQVEALAADEQAHHDVAERLRQEILALGRRQQAGDKGVTEELEAKKRERTELDERFAEKAQLTELQRERAQAARRLRHRCETYLAELGQ